MEQSKELYPTDILPLPTFKQRMDVDFLLTKYKSLLVVRMIEGRIDDYLLETEAGEKKLSEKVFANSMANLSLNLVGGLFDTRSHAHLRFLPCGDEATRTWNGERVPPELYQSSDNYKIYEACFGLYFLCRDIHNRTFPFYKHFESQEERDAYEKQVVSATSDEEKAYDAHFVDVFESKKCSVRVNPRIKLHHSPTMLNYWHMTLDTYRPTDTDYIHPAEKLKSADRTMFKALKQDLLQCCQIEILPDYRIERCDYLNETVQ